MRETDSGLAWQQSQLLVSRKNIPLAGHAVYSPQRQRHLEKEGIYTARARKVIPLLKAINWKWNSELYKKEEKGR